MQIYLHAAYMYSFVLKKGGYAPILSFPCIFHWFVFRFLQDIGISSMHGNPHPRTVNPKFPINLYHRVAAKKVCFSFGKIWYTYNISYIYIYMFFFQLYFSRYYVEEHVHGTFETDPRRFFGTQKNHRLPPSSPSDWCGIPLVTACILGGIHPNDTQN